MTLNRDRRVAGWPSRAVCCREAWTLRSCWSRCAWSVVRCWRAIARLVSLFIAKACSSPQRALVDP
jgi:hypothetical protein